MVSDFYRRFLRRGAAEGHYVMVSRIVTALLVLAAAYVSWQLTSIRGGWEAVAEIGAGTGGVYLLRWYWWRINAWSEISAMIVALACTIFLHAANPFSGQPEFIVFAKTTLLTTLVTTVAWVVVTFATKPESDEMLLKFYRKVRPDAAGWKRVAAMAPETPQTHDLGTNLVSWLLGCVMVYCTLFGVGEICFERYSLGAMILLAAIISAAVLYGRIARITSSPGIETEPERMPAGALH